MPAKGTRKDFMELIGADLDARILADNEEAELQDSVQEISASTNTVIEAARRGLNFLAVLAMPLIFKYKFPPLLLGAWSLLLKLAELKHDFSKVALGIPRGHGKTTLIKLFVLWCILFTDRKFILVIASTATKAEAIISDIADFLNESNIARVFGSWQIGIEKNTNDIKKFGFRGRNITLAALGAGGSVRGLNIKNERPDIMIFEDIQEKENSESREQADALMTWMVGTAMKAKSPHGCLTIFCGNMYPGPHSILKKLKDNPQWISFTTGAILADGTALWPQLRPIEDLLDEFDSDISMGKPEVFLAEVLNDTDVAINSRIDLSGMADWPWGNMELPQGRFIIIDPSGSKSNSDATAIIHVEVYDEKPGVREVMEEVLSPGATILKAILWCLRHNIKCVGIEAVAYQSTLLYWFNKECERLGITGIFCVPLFNSQSSKNSRIHTMLTGLSTSETILHPDVRSAVIHQIANWKPLKRDNVDGLLDCLTYIPRMIQDYPEYIQTDTALLVQEASGAKVIMDNHAF